MAVSIDDLQCALANGAGGAIGGRNIAYQHKTGAQDPECRTQTGQTTRKEGDCIACVATGRGRRRERPLWVQLHDGGTFTLQVEAVVEIADQDIAGGDRRTRKAPGYEGDTVRIEIAVGGNRGGIDEPGNERVIRSTRGTKSRPETEARRQC